MLDKRKQMKRFIISIIGHSFIAGSAIAFSLCMICGAITTNTASFGVIATGILLFGIGIFSTIRGDKIHKVLRGKIDELTATPLEKHKQYREKEKENETMDVVDKNRSGDGHSDSLSSGNGKNDCR